MKHENFDLFFFHDCTVEENGFEYFFSLKNSNTGQEFEFRPRWTCPDSIKLDPTDAVLRELIFNLGMAELISYWKSACPPAVSVDLNCGHLDDWQISWWKKLYKKGLGEFFFINKIAPKDDFMTIICENARSFALKEFPQRALSGNMIPVGGGKDSIVTIELLRGLQENAGDNLCYIIGDVKRAVDSAKTAGYSDARILQVNRTIDPTLLELNKRGFLNGHTPFSAIVAFSSLVFAYSQGKKHIILSNESSADEGNVQGSDVNHQYSKSTEFERDFREYVGYLQKLYSRELPNYFSLLRPWNELQITRKFAQYPQYFKVFQSCNIGTRTNTWCGKCAKCLYIYIMLAAFISKEDLYGIFGKDLLKAPELTELFAQLTEYEHDKPFECVGTREEMKAALNLAAGKHLNSDILSRFNGCNFVPPEFLNLLNV